MRTSKLTDKDMDVLDETRGAKQQVNLPYAFLKDYSLKHRVKMEWDLNKDAKRDMMFKLKIDDYEVILDWEEVLKAGRFI